MESKPDYQKQHEDFVAALLRECSDRGTRAELRRYWSEQTRHYAYPVLGKLRALDNAPRLIAASLFASHDREQSRAHRKGGATVGGAFLYLAGGGRTKPAYESTERHFRRLLACDSLDDLAPQLHRLVKRLERDGFPIDYVRLLRDLRFWNKNAERVKTDWSLDFWQAADTNTTQPDAA